jgi:hypothetical protein
MRHVLKRTWVLLVAALAIFALGLAIALYLHNILGRWERDNVQTIYRRYAEMLASTLQSQIDLFQVRDREGGIGRESFTVHVLKFSAPNHVRVSLRWLYTLPRAPRASVPLSSRTASPARLTAHTPFPFPRLTYPIR